MSFAPGDAVVVKNDWPETRGPAHIRTPHYVRGRTGRVVRALGRFPNPEDLAFARPAAERSLYHVTFPMQGPLAGRQWRRRCGRRDLRALVGAAMNIVETDGEALLIAVRKLLAGEAS